LDGTPAADVLRDRIVLLGGTYSEARDTHPTPGGESTSGLMINALAVEAELQGRGVEEFPRLLSLGLDIAYGITVLVLFARHEETRTAKRLRYGVAVVLPIAGSVLLGVLGVLWLSWVPMLIASFAWGEFLDGLLPD
jgi:CHASE2 domain-containing sensor protein